MTTKLITGDDLEEWLTATFGPAEDIPPWPSSLPINLMYVDNRGIEHEIVVPSWNAIPLREVVRSGCIVAVIDRTECDVASTVYDVELPTIREAQDLFWEIYARECEQASIIFHDLPDAMKEGALLVWIEKASGS
jgi:hypothetical protein